MKLLVDMEKQKGTDHIPLVGLYVFQKCAMQDTTPQNQHGIDFALSHLHYQYNPHLRHGLPGRCFLLHDFCLVNFRNWGENSAFNVDFCSGGWLMKSPSDRQCLNKIKYFWFAISCIQVSELKDFQQLMLIFNIWFLKLLASLLHRH